MPGEEAPLKLVVWEFKDGAWRIRDDMILMLHDTDSPGFYGSTEISTRGRLLWLRVEGANPAKFVALPPGDSIRVNFLHALGTDDDPVDVVVDAGNPRAETILGFLRRGDFAHARTVGTKFAETAEELLRGKVHDVAAATIGGYFLLLAGEVKRMHNWSTNLDKWFDFLPDGAVIHGWNCLREATADFQTARLRFIEAARRGVPVYTCGLRLLHDGLAMMQLRAREQGQSFDEAVEFALRKIRPYAAAADWNSASTSFYGFRPPRAS